MVNRYLTQWGYDHVTLTRPPPAVRFEARHSNDCWHFDLSPSDLKHVKQPWWVEEGRGQALLILYSVVDDRSGVCYQEYRCVYGEDVEGALRFLFNAMAPKPMEGFPFQGIRYPGDDPSRQWPSCQKPRISASDGIPWSEGSDPSAAGCEQAACYSTGQR
jgi:hypothetical protein